MRGLVLSGGGARGAYNAGVLSYLYGDFSLRLGRTPHLPIVSGASVGAVNGAFLASVADDPCAGIHRLTRLWRDLTFSRVLRFGMPQLARLPRMLLGERPALGLVDAQPLAALIAGEISWRKLRANIRSGELHALTVTATHVATGTPTVFLQSALPYEDVARLGRHINMQSHVITPHHVLASASIPLIFPPVQVQRRYYCDGALRFHTPLAPALHLGATQLLVVSVSKRVPSELPPHTTERVPTIASVLGKIFNAFLIDPFVSDLDELQLINSMMIDGHAAFGPEFSARLAQAAEARNESPRRAVSVVSIEPSINIGKLTADYLREQRPALRRTWSNPMVRALFDLDDLYEADLASYLLFDGGFASELMRLGYQDAAQKEEELLTFFNDLP